MRVFRLELRNKTNALAVGVYLGFELWANAEVGFTQVSRGSGCRAVGAYRYHCDLEFLSGVIRCGSGKHRFTADRIDQIARDCEILARR